MMGVNKILLELIHSHRSENLLFHIIEIFLVFNVNHHFGANLFIEILLASFRNV
jgi:hypothetical protein